MKKINKYLMFSLMFTLFSCSPPDEIKTKANLFCSKRISVDKISKIEDGKYKVTCRDKKSQTIMLNKAVPLFMVGECVKFPQRVPFLTRKHLKFTNIAPVQLTILAVEKEVYKVRVSHINTEQVVTHQELNKHWEISPCQTISTKIKKD